MGSGVGVSMNAPIRICTDNTDWAMPECKSGFLADNGSGYFLNRLKDKKVSYGIYLAVTGRRIVGKDNLKWGIATHYMSRDKFEPF